MKKRMFITILLLLSIVVTGCGNNGAAQTGHTDPPKDPIQASSDSTLGMNSKGNGQENVQENEGTPQENDKEIIRDNRVGIIPNTLEIPSIGVKANIEHVGLLENGQMDVPQGMESVAWYEPGTKPGAPGNSVINGHVDSKTGPAVFFDLKKLKKGDKVYVTDHKGEKRTFVVTESKVYPRDEAPLREIFGYSYRSNLNLITCTGEFNRQARTHEERLVVYTQLEE
jgi:LPXTG-site transpeptidase (sortase) family protein